VFSLSLCSLYCLVHCFGIDTHEVPCGNLPQSSFTPNCQSPRVLPSSQSTCSIPVLSCIGSRPASQQSLRDSRPERQSQWSSNATQRNGQVTTGLHRQAMTLSQPASQLTTRTSTSRHGHQDESACSPPGRDSHALPSVQCSDGPPFKVNTNVQCVRVILH
jgi:hypothetical protein